MKRLHGHFTYIAIGLIDMGDVGFRASTEPLMEEKKRRRTSVTILHHSVVSPLLKITIFGSLSADLSSSV